MTAATGGSQLVAMTRRPAIVAAVTSGAARRLAGMAARLMTPERSASTGMVSRPTVALVTTGASNMARQPSQATVQRAAMPTPAVAKTLSWNGTLLRMPGERQAMLAEVSARAVSV